jgi:hypothetical protein
LCSFDADADGPACDPNTITITMDSLSEVDAEGNAVGASGSVKHSINSFAPQRFEFALPEQVKIGTAHATKVAFSTPFKGLGDSKLSVDTYLMTHSGDVGTDTETWTVNQGDIKFNLLLTDWDWCGGTTSVCGKGQAVEVGAFIDVVVSVKGKSDLCLPPLMKVTASAFAFSTRRASTTIDWIVNSIGF